MRNKGSNKGSITLAVILGVSLIASLLGGVFIIENKVKDSTTKIKKLENEVKIFSDILKDQLIVQDNGIQGISLGAAQNPVGGKTYFLSGSGVSASQTTIPLTNFDIAGGTQNLVMTDFGSLGCGTIEPGHATRQEFISFTGVTQNSDGSATLTGVQRGLSPIPNYAASTTLQDAHTGGSQFVLSNSPPCFYQDYASLSQAESIQGVYTFSSTSQPVYDATPQTTSNPLQLAHISFVNSVATAGCANATTTASTFTTGCVKIATSTMAANTTASSTIVNVLSAEYSTSSPYAIGANGPGNVVVVTQASSTIASIFIDQTAGYYWTGSTTINTASTTITSTGVGTTTIANNLVLAAASSTNGRLWLGNAGLSYTGPNLGTFNATDTVPTLNANGNISFIKPYPVLDTFIPKAIVSTSTGQSQLNVNTTAICGMFNMPAEMNVSKISVFSVATAGTAGTIDIGIYRIDNSSLATKIMDVTTGTISANNTIYNATGNGTTTPGNYYLCTVPNGTADVTLTFHNQASGGNLATVTSEPVYGGTVTVSAGTLPTTFNPITAITQATAAMLYVRFDGQ